MRKSHFILVLLLAAVSAVFLIVWVLSLGGDMPNLFPAYSGNMQVINKAIANYHLAGEHIDSAQTAEFYLEGRMVYFVHIAYGEGQDCPAGCIFNHLCVILDGEEFYTYRDASPTRLHAPELKNHPLIQSEVFENFLNENRYSSSEFRWCA
ncbi:hypothetical protein KKH30_01250 [Candidatus Micrarchaeota archaeon]|nr:hypothetical protein [Candidatus Micrarchaeota archaeon]MBU1939368.1 hypothetical protein [Candidatus Micrarchaeota archaeon]